MVAAETGTGQADSKPEVEHEDDEHVRTEDSSCVGGGETPDRFTPRPRTQALRALALSAARQGERLTSWKLRFVAFSALQPGKTVAELLGPSFPQDGS